jgi:hypothetical protein
MADVQQWQPAPGPTLAVAASITDLRVGYLGVRLSAADAELKSVRAANYIRTLRRDLVKVAEACGNNRWWRMSRRSRQATSVRTRRFSGRRTVPWRGQS